MCAGYYAGAGCTRGLGDPSTGRVPLLVRMVECGVAGAEERARVLHVLSGVPSVLSRSECAVPFHTHRAYAPGMVRMTVLASAGRRATAPLSASATTRDSGGMPASAAAE